MERTERCCCCIHIYHGSCAIAVIQLIFSFIWSGICFMILYAPQSNFHLPHNINEFILEEYGTTLGQHVLMWAFLIALFLSSIFVLIAHSATRPKWYIPSLVVNVLLIGRYSESQIVYILNTNQLHHYFWIYFAFVVINTYFTIMLFKGKTYMEWLLMENFQAKHLDEFVVHVDRDVDEYQPQQPSTSQKRATAPPMSENEYYVLH